MWRPVGESNYWLRGEMLVAGLFLLLWAVYVAENEVASSQAFWSAAVVGAAIGSVLALVIGRIMND